MAASDYGTIVLVSLSNSQTSYMHCEQEPEAILKSLALLTSNNPPQFIGFSHINGTQYIFKVSEIIAITLKPREVVQNASQ